MQILLSRVHTITQYTPHIYLQRLTQVITVKVITLGVSGEERIRRATFSRRRTEYQLLMRKLR